MSEPWPISIETSPDGPVRIAGLATGAPNGGSQPGIRARLVRTFTFADTPTDGTVFTDLYDIPEGTLVWDFMFNHREAWDSSTPGITFAVTDGFTDQPIPNGISPVWPLASPTAAINDSALISGNSGWGGPGPNMYGANVISGGIGDSPYLPFFALTDLTLKATYSGGDAPATGDVDVYIVVQDAGTFD